MFMYPSMCGCKTELNHGRVLGSCRCRKRGEQRGQPHGHIPEISCCLTLAHQPRGLPGPLGGSPSLHPLIFLSRLLFFLPPTHPTPVPQGHWLLIQVTLRLECSHCSDKLLHTLEAQPPDASSRNSSLPYLPLVLGSRSRYAPSSQLQNYPGCAQLGIQ